MPDRIRYLPEGLADQIAAGEVVERPASVLKELVENSIDAEGTQIVIKIEKGGARLISVIDNGTGMSGKDAVMAFGRHATSKISSKDDLFNIRTLGFRGEALASIAAVARVRLKTRERDAVIGTCVEMEGGHLVKSMDMGCPAGTEIEVRDIFYNVPARRSFLKAPATELGHMLNIVTQHALAYSHIHLTLVDGERGNRPLLDLPPVKGVEERVFQIYSGDVAEEMVRISSDSEGCYIHGLISKPSLTFKGKENQMFFVNKRSVRNPTLSHAVQEAYLDLIPRDRCPMVVLFIDVDPGSVDVNVHPSKREVKFKDNRYIHERVVAAIRESLQAKGRPSIRHYKEGDGSAVRYEIHEGMADPFDGVGFQAVEIPVGPSIRVLGQFGVLFIMAEIDGEFHIIDQHAAHERVIYDTLRKGYENPPLPPFLKGGKGGLEVQGLLIPETIELSLDKAQILKVHKDPLRRIGFDMEETGDRSFMIRTVPALFTGEDCRALITDMIDEIFDADYSSGKDLKCIAIEEIIKALLSRRACHKAVRAKGFLSHGEMSSLLSALLQTDMPYTCPHGRPIVKRFSSDELAKMFGRK